MTDDRAVSATLTYVLTLTVVTLLISGLFVTSSTFVEDQRDRVIRSEFDVLGHRLAADLAAADRMARTVDGSGSVHIAESLPDAVANTPYRIVIESTSVVGGNHDVTLTYTTSSPSINVSVSLHTRTDVVDTTIPGGAIEIDYDSSNDELEVSHG